MSRISRCNGANPSREGFHRRSPGGSDLERIIRGFMVRSVGTNQRRVRLDRAIINNIAENGWFSLKSVEPCHTLQARLNDTLVPVVSRTYDTFSVASPRV